MAIFEKILQYCVFLCWSLTVIPKWCLCIILSYVIILIYGWCIIVFLVRQDSDIEIYMHIYINQWLGGRGGGVESKISDNTVNIIFCNNTIDILLKYQGARPLRRPTASTLISTYIHITWVIYRYMNLG